MRDDIELSADVYLPRLPGRYPAILERTPYDNANPSVMEFAAFFARHGYAFVAQDVRGRGDSDGEFVAFEHEGQDGYDTVEWVASQPWCDGQVAMMGLSYAAFVQWVAAREQPPHLATFVSTATSGRWVQDPQLHGKLRPYLFIWLHRVAGKTMQPVSPSAQGEQLIDWWEIISHRPYRDIDVVLGRTNTVWREWLANSDNPGYWEKLSAFHSYEKIDVPVLHITGWYDGSAPGAIHTFEQMCEKSPARGNQFLVVGPWDHSGTRTPKRYLGGIDFGEQAVIDMHAVHLRWFDYWLKGIPNGQDDEARVSLFTMRRNQWRDSGWPPVGSTECLYYLDDSSVGSGSDDHRLVLDPPESEGADEYLYDPDEPTPSTPDRNAFLISDAPLEHTYAEARDDVLTYTSNPLGADVEVTGTPIVHLYAATSAVDTDFAITLCDVHPDGSSFLIAEGLVRTMYRSGDGSREPVLPDAVNAYRIALGPTSVEFQRGHSIRLCVASAAFPAYDRNPNTGAVVGDDEVTLVARQRIHHGGAHLSHLVLPVIAQPLIGGRN